jgi:hypothetical protein
VAWVAWFKRERLLEPLGSDYLPVIEVQSYHLYSTHAASGLSPEPVSCKIGKIHRTILYSHRDQGAVEPGRIVAALLGGRQSGSHQSIHFGQTVGA